MEVKIHPDGQGLLVATRNPDKFYTLLNRIVLDNQIGRRAVAPADDNVHSVYQYLIGSTGVRLHELGIVVQTDRRYRQT